MKTIDVELSVQDLQVGDLVDMEPVYERYDLTDESDYLVSQYELSMVDDIEILADRVIVGFNNVSTFTFALGEFVIVAKEES